MTFAKREITVICLGCNNILRDTHSAFLFYFYFAFAVLPIYFSFVYRLFVWSFNVGMGQLCFGADQRSCESSPGCFPASPKPQTLTLHWGPLVSRAATNEKWIFCAPEWNFSGGAQPILVSLVRCSIVSARSRSLELSDPSPGRQTLSPTKP